MKTVIRFILLLAIFSQTSLFAGTTGKISGTIRDTQSDEPLPGANIIIEGTTMGASANLQGFYYIINVPPGEYTVKATMVGYGSLSKTQVRVVTDVTTKVDFELSPTVIEMGAVTVVAERPAIQKDLTSSLQAFGGDEIDKAPVENLPQLLETQTGLSSVEPTERASIIRNAPGDGLHIRGGRENETAFVVDGARVDNPIWGGANYTQNTSGSTVTEMMTILGTFNAEYGGKMSGVVNMVTKEGSQKYSGKFSGYTDNFGIPDYDRNTFQAEGTFSGPVPSLKKLTFFTNAQIRTTDGRFKSYLIPKWTDSKGQVPIEDEHGNPLGEEVAADWKDEWNTLMKLTWKASPAFKIMGSFVAAHVKKVKYYHDYKYLPYGMPWSDTKSSGLTLKLTHLLSPSTFYELVASYQKIDYWMGVHKTREQRIAMESREEEDIYGFYYTGAYNDFWADTTRTFQLVFNMTSQVASTHLLKAGVDFRHIDLFHRYENAWTTPGSEIDGEFYVNHKAYTNSRPIEWAVYVQDKMEFESIGMILNAGLRLESWNIDEKYMLDPQIPFDTILLETEPKVRFSPRLGISYPISDRAAFHFAYGHFYQFASYVNLLSGINEEGRFPDRPNLQDIGLAIHNPNMKPEKSITYEAGVQSYVMENLSMNLTAFYRELADLAGVTWIQGAESYVYFDNVDFGNSKGLELTLDKRFSHYFSGRVNYTLSQTLISTSSPMTAAETVSSEPIAYKTWLADWDRTHDLAALIRISDPKNWAVSLNGKMKSGRPYSELAEQKNTKRMPWNINVDMRLSKYFNFFGLRETLYLQIFNVFNRKNIYWVYDVTGKWNDDGDADTPPAHDANPRRISDGRIARIGLQVVF
ncbi:MAG: TonB-dependent receptor [Gemmatimonadota bacterium]|nr:MAG: TonB-dependent receptor [Gemmatimonadota bacterium]